MKMIQKNQPSKMTFTEKVNIQNVKAVRNLTYADAIKVFDLKDEISQDGNKYTSKTYYNNIIKYCKTILSIADKKDIKDFMDIEVDYKYAKGQVNGRTYTNKFSIQSLSCNIKKFICDGCNYIDYDMKNAHPTLALFLAKGIEFDTPILAEYVKNRNPFLMKHNIKKIDFLCVLNRDNENKKQKDILKKLSTELLPFKKKIVADLGYLIENKKSKSKQKVSSIFNKILCFFENKILQKVFKKYGDSVAVPYFDGFLSKKKIEISELNKISKKYGITWSIKNMKNKINIENSLLTENDKVDKYFEWIAMASENDVAERFLKNCGAELKEKYKYIQLKKGSWWFEYNENNILIQTDKAPLSLNQMITDIMVKELKKYYKLAVDLYPNNSQEFTQAHYLYTQSNKKFGKNSYKKAIIQELTYLCRDDSIIDKIDTKNHILAFKDGCFDFKGRMCIDKSGKEIYHIGWRDIEKDDYIQTYINYEIPEENKIIQDDISKTIKSMFKSDEDYNYLMESLGFSLFTNKFETLNIWSGTGGNGKGVLLNLLKCALGDYMKITESTFLTTKMKSSGTADPDLADCRGKKIVMTSEPNSNEDEIKFNAGKIKMITGKDLITARKLYDNPVSFVPTFTTFIQTNEIPSIDKCDKAIQRRFKCLQFPFNFVIDIKNPEFEKKRDNTLKDKLSEEKYYQQFIFLLIEAVNKNDDILEFEPKDKLTIPESVDNFTKDYLDDNNFVGSFIDIYFKKSNQKDKKSFITTKKLYELYCQYGEHSLKKKDFKYNMKSMGYIEKRNQSKKLGDIGKGYYGLSFINQTDDFLSDEDDL